MSPDPTQIGVLRLAMTYGSSPNDAAGGGDFYDVISTVWGVRLLVGDVSGRGIDAEPLARRMRAAFRGLAAECRCLSDAINGLDRVVTETSEHEEQFVTAVLVQIEPSGRGLIVNAGHPDPLLIRRGVIQYLSVPTRRPPLGFGGNTAAHTFRLASDDRILLYSDGLIEARRPDDRMFFPLERLASRTLAGGPVEDGVTALRAALGDWTAGHLEDDLALLAAQYVVPSHLEGHSETSQGAVASWSTLRAPRSLSVSGLEAVTATIVNATGSR